MQGAKVEKERPAKSVSVIPVRGHGILHRVRAAEMVRKGQSGRILITEPIAFSDELDVK